MPNINWTAVIENLLPIIIGSIVLGIWALIKRKKITLFFKKLWFLIFPVDFQIAFALEFDEGLNSGNYYKQIKRDLLKLIHKSGLSNQIKVSDISDIFLFQNTDEAEKFRQIHNIDLIIWGDFTNDNLKIEKEIVNKLDLNFTFRIPQNDKNILSMISLDLTSKFAQKSYWKIFENNSLRDIEIISNNIFDISTYILALSLKIFGKLEKSTNLFENLYKDLKRRNDSLHIQIIPHLLNCYEILSLEYGLYRKEYKMGITYCNKIMNIDPNSFTGLCNLAIYQYHLGFKDKAYQNIEKLKQLYPNSDITLLDVAFFNILEKDYQRALNGYKKLKKKYRNVTFNIPEVVEFMDEQYKEQNEPAFLFTSGFLNCNYGDFDSGKKDFNLFLKKADKQVHAILIREVKRLLSIDYK